MYRAPRRCRASPPPRGASACSEPAEMQGWWMVGTRIDGMVTSARRRSNRQQFHRYWRRATYYTQMSHKQVLCSDRSPRTCACPDRFATWLDRSTTPNRTNAALWQQENTHRGNAISIGARTICFLCKCIVCTCISARRGREISRSIENHRSPGAHAPLHAHWSGGTSGNRLPPSRSLLSDKKYRYISQK